MLAQPITPATIDDRVRPGRIPNFGHDPSPSRLTSFLWFVGQGPESPRPGSRHRTSDRQTPLGLISLPFYCASSHHPMGHAAVLTSQPVTRAGPWLCACASLPGGQLSLISSHLILAVGSAKQRSNPGLGQSTPCPANGCTSSHWQRGKKQNLAGHRAWPPHILAHTHRPPPPTHPHLHTLQPRRRPTGSTGACKAQAGNAMSPSARKISGSPRPAALVGVLQSPLTVVVVRPN